MSMTKKDFEAIAAAFKKQMDVHGDTLSADDLDFLRIVLEDLTEDLCRHFKTSNANFQRDRFMTACGF